MKPVLSSHGDTYHEICPHNWQNRKHQDVQIRGQCGKEPWSTMHVAHYWLLQIGHVALIVHQLYIIYNVDGCRPQYGFSHTIRHAASQSPRFRIHRQFLNVRSGSSFRWLHWQRGVELPGVCIVELSQRVVY